MRTYSKSEERAVEDFYLWEYRYRGWALFDYPVDLEVPFVPFPTRNYGYAHGYDDGKSLSLIQQMRNLVNPRKEEIIDEEIIYQYPKAVERTPDLCVLILSFPLGTDYSVPVYRELITTLSFTKDPVSFEIVARGDEITIQLVCSYYDHGRVRSHIMAYLPLAYMTEGDQWDMPFEQDRGDIAVIDFGLKQESMLPLTCVEHFDIDPLTSLFAIFESLKGESSAILQIIIQGIDNPLSSHFRYAVSDGTGGSFLCDVPELVAGTEIKTKSPLLSVALRLSVQGEHKSHTEYLGRECITSIISATTSQYNSLIPLSNHGYEYNAHVMNILYRSSYRHGMILSVNEVATLFHFPHKSITSRKLYKDTSRTKALPSLHIGLKYVLGLNVHNGRETEVSFNDEMRLKHTHVIGATGTGKSTLLANMILNDIMLGNGCALFDPHGDIVEDILLRIPEHRHKDVIVIDPSDTDYPVGFNLLYAQTEAEKLVLSSDLISAFRDNATSWGDTMTSVLQNVIDTFLDSSVQGTLIELKRFLIEDSFRRSFLEHVSDPQLLYYWKHEYGMVRKRISPLLTRLDTFLRPSIIRSMLVQKDGLDIGKSVHDKKIILFKLSLGLIGEHNAYLLGSMFLAKLNQVALSRQNVSKHERHPFYIYLDECQHFMSPSIHTMLSGVRKYGFGLILAHQYLGQITNATSLEALLSNPYTRISFRLSHTDAKKLENDFSGFDAQDILSLSRGHTIMRFGSNVNDCNVITFPLDDITYRERADVIRNFSREHYGKPKAVIEELLRSAYGSKDESNSVTTKAQEPQIFQPNETVVEHQDYTEDQPIRDDRDINSVREQIVRTETIREHRRIQANIKKMGQDFGFVSTIEHEIADGKRIDVSLERADLKIACEISVTNSAQYEVSNIQKSHHAGYNIILLISDHESHLNLIKTKAKKELTTAEYKKVMFVKSNDVQHILEATIPKEKPQTEIIKGFRVKTEFDSPNENEVSQFKRDIERILGKHFRR